jgi:chromate transport protein ChrA
MLIGGTVIQGSNSNHSSSSSKFRFLKDTNNLKLLLSLLNGLVQTTVVQVAKSCLTIMAAMTKEDPTAQERPKTLEAMITICAMRNFHLLAEEIQVLDPWVVVQLVILVWWVLWARNRQVVEKAEAWEWVVAGANFLYLMMQAIRFSLKACL